MAWPGLGILLVPRDLPPPMSSLVHLALRNVLSAHQGGLLLDSLPSPAVCFAVWNVLFHRNKRTIDPDTFRKLIFLFFAKFQLWLTHLEWTKKFPCFSCCSHFCLHTVRLSRSPKDYLCLWVSGVCSKTKAASSYYSHSGLSWLSWRTRTTCCTTTTTHFHFPVNEKDATKGNQDKCQSSARHEQSGPGNLLAYLRRKWDQYLATCWLSGCWQPGGCHPVPRERHPLTDGTKVAVPGGLPISMLVCVFNTGLNGKDKRQHPFLFLRREVLVFQLLMLLWLMHMDAYMHKYEGNLWIVSVFLLISWQLLTFRSCTKEFEN